MLRYAMLTDKGSRENNEDAVGGIVSQEREEGCFVLCDGLGGHGQGEVASQFVVEEIQKAYRLAVSGEAGSDFLETSIMKSQEGLLALQKEHHASGEMKTTAVILQVREEEVQWEHVGDSRLYYFQKGKLRQRTFDHSVPQMLAAAGEIKEKEIRHHPDRNRLLRVMGIEWDSPKYALEEPVARTEGQAFLLCSDGFWELIEEKEMQKCLRKAKSPDEWLGFMKEIILKKGKNQDMDNYSAIAVFG